MRCTVGLTHLRPAYLRASAAVRGRLLGQAWPLARPGAAAADRALAARACRVAEPVARAAPSLTMHAAVVLDVLEHGDRVVASATLASRCAELIEERPIPDRSAGRARLDGQPGPGVGLLL